MDPAEMDAPPPATSFPASSTQRMDPAEMDAPPPATSFPASSTRGDGNKAALGEMAGPSVMPLQLEEVDPELEEGDPEGDIDKQWERWEYIDEQRQLWDANDEHRKLRKKDEKRQKHEERRQKQEERRQKQEERRQKQDENKKIKLELAQKKVDKKKKLGLSLRKKELQIRRDKKATDMNKTHKLKVAEGGGSPHGVTRSSGVNYLKSRLGVLANVAASKRGRPLSDIEGSSASQKNGKSVASSPSLPCSPSSSRSPSPATSSLGGSRKKHPRGRKIRRLTSTVWKDFSPRYNDGKLIQAVCKHCNEVMAAGREMGTSGVRRHLDTCPIRSDLRLIVDKLKSSVTSPNASVLKNWEFDQKISRQLLARMIVRDEMPFSIVQYSGFLEFVKSLNPLFKMVSRNTIKEDIMQLYYDKKSYMEKGFKMFAGRVSLTTDDVQTRWNSTYLMLESAMPFRKAFHTLAKEDTNYKFCPSSTEWRRAETVCSILKVFHTATNLVSASTYPTSNLYFHEVWNVKLVLEKEASRKDEPSRKDGVINSMLEDMQEKFNKYWLESYLANSIAVILDPRFKKGFIDFRLEQAFGRNSETHIERVEAALIGLFNEYSSEMSNSCSQSAETEHTDEARTEQDNLADWDRHLSKKQRQSNNEMDRYLQEDLFPRKDDLDILQWWALHCSQYPVLSRIARDVLAVPASVVPSESAFSTGHRVVSDYRSRLKSSTVEALICLQDWLKNYESLVDIVDDSDL